MKVNAAFLRYRVMSYVCGTTLLLLFVILILKWTTSKQFQHEAVFQALDRILGIGHGVVLYPIYLVLASIFAIQARLKVSTLVLMLLAGFIPGLAFYMEHWIEKTYGFPRTEVTA